MILAIAGPLIIAPLTMQWEGLFHEILGKKHKRLKTQLQGQ
jgi:hypothetical protein